MLSPRSFTDIKDKIVKNDDSKIFVHISKVKKLNIYYNMRSFYWEDEKLFWYQVLPENQIISENVKIIFHIWFILFCQWSWIH